MGQTLGHEVRRVDISAFLGCFVSAVAQMQLHAAQHTDCLFPVCLSILTLQCRHMRGASWTGSYRLSKQKPRRRSVRK
jgi:hypothetical protein